MNNSVIGPDFNSHVKAALAMIASQEIPNNLASKPYVGNLVSNTISASSAATTTSSNSYRFPLVTLPTSQNTYLIEVNLLSTITGNPGIIASSKLLITAFNTGSGVSAVNLSQTVLSDSGLWYAGVETIGNTVYIGAVDQNVSSVTWVYAITSIIGTPVPFTVQPPE